MVEEVFRTTGGILHLHVAGEVIRTTAQHPFYAHEKGWIEAELLQPNDWLLGADGNWRVVEDVFDTGEEEVVYNLRVADWHTYFVAGGNDSWSVWAHNACVYQAVGADGVVRYVGIANRGLTKTIAQRLRIATKRTGQPAQVIPGLSDVPSHVAEAVELTLIKHFGTFRTGGSLINKSNGTRFKTFSGDKIQEMLQLGTEWLKKARYPGF